MLSMKISYSVSACTLGLVNADFGMFGLTQVSKSGVGGHVHETPVSHIQRWAHGHSLNARR